MTHKIHTRKTNGAFTHILTGWVKKGKQMYNNTRLRKKRDCVPVHLPTGPPSKRSYAMIK